MAIIDTYRHKGMRKQMVDRLRAKGFDDKIVLEALETVPRHIFFDSSFVEIAYQEDSAFPIGAGQTISQVSTVAFQSSILNISPRMKVLEIGTGSGYQACVLAVMGAKVFSIERQRNLYLKTKALLSELPYQINTFLGDGFAGLPTFGPFDRIIITAAAPEVPEALINQLKTNGIIIIPLDNNNGDQTMLRLTKMPDGSLQREEFGNFKFVPMLKNIGNDR